MKKKHSGFCKAINVAVTAGKKQFILHSERRFHYFALRFVHCWIKQTLFCTGLGPLFSNVVNTCLKIQSCQSHVF